jgi:hypothetical protein
MQVRQEGEMSDLGSLKINHRNDWTNHSKVVIKTDNQDLMNSLMRKVAEMTANGFGKVIYNFGVMNKELRIFSRLGSGTDVLSHLLDGHDRNRLSAEATIETIN